MTPHLASVSRAAATKAAAGRRQSMASRRTPVSRESAAKVAAGRRLIWGMDNGSVLPAANEALYDVMP